MKKLLLVLTMLFCYTTMTSAKELSVAFVNGQQIFQKYRAGIDQKLEKEFGARKEAIVALQKNINSQSEKLQRDHAVLAKEEVKTIQRELEQKQREFQRLSQAYEEDFNTRGNQELQALGEKLQVVVDQVAQDKAFDIVLQRGAAVFVDRKFDITADVLRKLEKS